MVKQYNQLRARKLFDKSFGQAQDNLTNIAKQDKFEEDKNLKV